ncbi:MAG: GNAT family N-acetyltransferase [Saprospiraceae bacterium]
MDDLTIIDYQPVYQSDFKRLNLAWISRYFTVETHDLEQLDDPEHHILRDGGHILLAKTGAGIVGTVAMVQVEPGVWELAKMAVDEAFQGRQIGKRLGEAAIAWAREQPGGREIFLESNRRLAPALALYQRLGFQEVPLQETPYTRADIKMSMRL